MISASNNAAPATDDYHMLYQGFHWHVPPDFNIAQLCCIRWAGDAQRIAIHYEDDAGNAASLTYADLLRDATRLAQAMRRHGVARGDRVAIVLPQRPETAVAHIACHLIGAVAMPLSIAKNRLARKFRGGGAQSPHVRLPCFGYLPFSASGSATVSRTAGRVNRNIVPPCGLSWWVIVPPWNSIAVRQMFSPRPIPWALVE